MRKLKKSRHRLPGIDTDLVAEMVCDGRDLFVVLNGVKIAKRGQSGSAWEWISLKPGYRVLDVADGSEMRIEHNGVALH
jgi:hypothetical protein